MITGIGIGFRYAMAHDTLATDAPEIRWLEIHPENYLWRGGRYESLLADASARFPTAPPTRFLTAHRGAA